MKAIYTMAKNVKAELEKEEIENFQKEKTVCFVVIDENEICRFQQMKFEVYSMHEFININKELFQKKEVFRRLSSVNDVFDYARTIFPKYKFIGEPIITKFKNLNELFSSNLMKNINPNYLVIADLNAKDFHPHYMNIQTDSLIKVK